MNRECLFVYGTLRNYPGSVWSRFLEGKVELVASARTNGRLFQLDGHPGMKPAEAADEWVIGELYRVIATSMWPVLDEYEGQAYARRKLPVHMEGGEIVDAWVYLYLGDLSLRERIISGDYLNPAK